MISCVNRTSLYVKIRGNLTLIRFCHLQNVMRYGKNTGANL